MTTTVSIFSTVTATVTSTKTLTRTILTSTSLSTMSNDGQSSTSFDHGVGHDYDSLYPYRPSLPLSAIFTVLYLLVTVHHGYLSLYLPSRPLIVDRHRYTTPLFLAGLFSTLGYLLRCISIQKAYVSDISLYSVSMTLILISPIFVCATLYLLLARLITRCLPTTTTTRTPTTPHHATSPSATLSVRTDQQKLLAFRPKFLGIVFITSDAVAFLVQVTGSVIASSHNWTDPTLTQGTRVLLFSLCLQLATFLLYLVVLHLFCRRVQSSYTTGFNPLIWKVVVATWIASGFILIRSVFRVVEFGMGPHGYPFVHEWCLYVFEGFDVWVALVVLGWWHPIKWIQEKHSIAVEVRAPNYIRADSGAVGSGGYEQAQGPVRRRSRLGLS